VNGKDNNTCINFELVLICEKEAFGTGYFPGVYSFPGKGGEEVNKLLVILKMETKRVQNRASSAS
jgi:hypothetical protein